MTVSSRPVATPVVDTAIPHSPATHTTTTSVGGWILSSATPPAAHHHVATDGDGCWYTRLFNEYLTETIGLDRSLPTLFEEGIEMIGDLYLSQLPADVEFDPAMVPGATVACLRWADPDTIEYFALGDSTIWVRHTDGRHSRICAVDGSLHDADFDIEHQLCLDIDPELVRYARTGSLPTTDVESILVTSAFVDTAIEQYDTVASYDEFESLARHHSLDTVINDLTHPESETEPIHRSSATDSACLWTQFETAEQS
jgi:hypothetical protein